MRRKKKDRWHYQEPEMVRLNLGTEEASKMIAVGANWDSILTLEAHRVFKEYTEKFSHS